MNLSEADREAIEQRVRGLLDGPFRLLGSFVPNYACSFAGLLVLVVQGAGVAQFSPSCQLTGVPVTGPDLEPLRVFLRDVERQLSRKLRGELWTPGESPVTVGQMLCITLEGKPVACRVIAIDEKRDTITLARPLQ